MKAGIINLPLEKGRKELSWQVGRGIVQGTNLTNVVIGLRINKDADFVATRLWLVQSPCDAPYSVVKQAGLLPTDASVIYKYGGAGNQKLSLAAGSALAMNALSMDTREQVLMSKGLPAPFLLGANTVLYAEVTCPSRSVTPWAGDLYLVAEGYKLYPNEAEFMPKTVNAYALPYCLNGSLDLIQPAAGTPASFSEQQVTITNDGEGTFIAKGIRFGFNPCNGADPAALRDMLSQVGINILDSTSGSKEWVQDSTPNAGVVRCPAGIITGNYGFIPWSMPRFLDENANLRVRFVFEPWQTWPGSWTFPTNVTVSLYGALLPRGV
jgi:hypothetical protein